MEQERLSLVLSRKDDLVEVSKMRGDDTQR